MTIAYDLHQYIQGSSRGTLLAAGCLSFVAYLVGLAVYRLYLSPIAKFPGPKLAAVTRWYEFYYDVVLRGQYSNRIAELHKIYGPIVRVAPGELHVNDPQFHHVLFTKSSKSFKDPFFNPRAGNESSMFSTCDPVHHKLRRGALNPYFSKRAIGKCEDMIQSKIEYACSKVLEAQENDKVVNLARMWDAYSGDIIIQYGFGFSYNNLHSEDFSKTFHKAFLAITEFGLLNCQFPIMGPILESLPDWFVRLTNPPLGEVLTLIRDFSTQIEAIKGELKRGMKPSQLTLFHEMLSAGLPPEETAPRRMRDEAQTVVGAGLTTTAWSLSHTCYYLAESEALQAKLHAELMDAIPDIHAEGAFAFQKLESLPYLRGCVKEGIRLALGVSGRNARILDSNLPYQHWIIPPGTSVSMNTQDISLNPDIFPNPGELVPERWAGNPQAPDGNSLEQYFVAFGKGPRQCLGINLAYMEIFLGLAHVFRKYRLELYETDRSDILMAHDFFLPSPKLDTKGVRVKVAEVFEK